VSNVHHLQSRSNVNTLLRETLSKAFAFFRRENRRREQESFEEQMAEIRACRWGYPIPRRGRRW
jgi:hypothetical protein